MAVSIGFLEMWIMFYGIIWGWAVIVTESPPGVWHKVFRDIQAKIDASHSLSSFAACLQQATPERNATIADISTLSEGDGLERGL
jgi:hypothetical protein